MTVEKGARETERYRSGIQGKKSKQYAVLPYMKDITERLQRDFGKHDIALYAKTAFTIRNAVVSPRDPLDLGEQCGVIYECACEVCGTLYVGETGRSMRERVDEQC